MCPACFRRLLPLISKSYWNKEMRIMGKPNKSVELWSLSTWCFKPFLEIYISVQFKCQMDFFSLNSGCITNYHAVCLGTGLEEQQR